MALKQIIKGKSLGSVADVTEELKRELQRAAIFAIDTNGVIQQTEVGLFLLNPNTWSESKTTNWSMIDTPGNSDPILQWSGGGARTVSFQALVTTDTADFKSDAAHKPGKDTNSNRPDISFSGQIASSFFKTAEPAPRMPSSRYTNLDISEYLNYYRSLLYPFNENNRLKQSPPLIALYTGSAISNIPLGGNGGRITQNSDVWVLTNLNIKITKQTPNLAPMEALVDFTLTQYTINSISREKFLE